MVILMLVGLPARASEFVLSTYDTPSHGQPRSMYFTGHEVLLLQSYAKQQAVTDHGVMVPRFLSVKVSQMLVDYFAFVRPLEILYCHTLGPEALLAYEEKIFVIRGTPMSAHQFQDSFFTHMLTYADADVGIRKYRQFAVALSGLLKGDEKVWIDLTAITHQAAHGTEVNVAPTSIFWTRPWRNQWDIN
jgi:hypothetical protein